jgi:hypothetical protein
MLPSARINAADSALAGEVTSTDESVFDSVKAVSRKPEGEEAPLRDGKGEAGRASPLCEIASRAMEILDNIPHVLAKTAEQSSRDPKIPRTVASPTRNPPTDVEVEALPVFKSAISLELDKLLDLVRRATGVEPLDSKDGDELATLLFASIDACKWAAKRLSKSDLLLARLRSVLSSMRPRSVMPEDTSSRAFLMSKLDWSMSAVWTCGD